MQWLKVNKPCGRIRFTIKNLLCHQTTVQLFAESASSAIINVMCFLGMELYVILGEMIKQPTHIMSPLESVNYTLMLVWYKSAKLVNFLSVSFYVTALTQPEIDTYMPVENVSTTWFQRQVQNSYIFWNSLVHQDIFSLRFFYESYDSSATASLQSCVKEYYLNSLPAFAIFPDDSTNKCWFGSPSVLSGSFPLSGSSWTVFVKQSMWVWYSVLSMHNS